MGIDLFSLHWLIFSNILLEVAVVDKVAMAFWTYALMKMFVSAAFLITRSKIMSI